jgi:hypothetical protein
VRRIAVAPNFAERIKPVDPERFRFALGVYCAAAALKGPAPNPEEFGIDILEDDGSATRISFTDRPENRGMLAVKKEFPDPAEFQSMSFRLLTFGEIMKDRKLRKWGLVRDGETGQTEIHDAVISALATAPFRKSGALDRGAFLASVKAESEKPRLTPDGA